jgi:hypothetical protein
MSSKSESTRKSPPPDAEYRGPVLDTVVGVSAALGGIKTAVDLYGTVKGEEGQEGGLEPLRFRGCPPKSVRR